MQYLSDRNAVTPVSDILRVFGPLMVDEGVFDGYESALPTNSLATFRQCSGYVKELCRTGTPPCAWQSTTLETVHRFVGKIIGFSCYYIVRNLVVPENTLQHHLSDALAKQVDDMLEDPALHQAMVDVKRKITETNPIERQLATFNMIQLESAQFMKNIFQCPSILQGFKNPGSTAIALRLFSTWSSEGLHRSEYHEDYYCDQLATCALALSCEDRPDRKAQLKKLIIISLRLGFYRA